MGTAAHWLGLQVRIIVSLLSDVFYQVSATDRSLGQRIPTDRGGLGPLGAVELWKRETEALTVIFVVDSALIFAPFFNCLLQF